MLLNISKGDTVAFEKLYHLYKDKIYALAVRWLKNNFEAEEITQEVFIGVWISRVGLRNVNDPKGYLFKIAYNNINKALKKETNQSRIRQFVYNQQDFSNITKEQLDANDLNRLIHAAIEQLPKQKKIVYRMSRQDGMSNEDIAKILRISPLTVKDHLKEAIRLLRNSLKSISIVLLILK